MPQKRVLQWQVASRNHQIWRFRTAQKLFNVASCRNNSGGFGFESEFVVRCQFASGVRETRERERETERERERRAGALAHGPFQFTCWRRRGTEQVVTHGTLETPCRPANSVIAAGVLAFGESCERRHVRCFSCQIDSSAWCIEQRNVRCSNGDGCVRCCALVQNENVAFGSGIEMARWFWCETHVSCPEFCENFCWSVWFFLGLTWFFMVWRECMKCHWRHVFIADDVSWWASIARDGKMPTCVPCLFWLTERRYVLIDRKTCEVLAEPERWCVLVDSKTWSVLVDRETVGFGWQRDDKCLARDIYLWLGVWIFNVCLQRCCDCMFFFVFHYHANGATSQVPFVLRCNSIIFIILHWVSISCFLV